MFISRLINSITLAAFFNILNKIADKFTFAAILLSIHLMPQNLSIICN